MKKYIKRLKTLLSDPSRSQNERVFIVLIILALTILFFALIGDIIYSENIPEIIVLILALVLVPWATFFGVRNNKIGIVSKIMAIALTFIIIPVTFIFGGGIQGVAVPWMIFAYLYIGLALTEQWKTIMIIVHTVLILSLIYAGYLFPEFIRERERSVIFLDCALSVVEVGIICFVMTRFQMWMFSEENKRAKEETIKVEELNSSQNRFFSSMSHEIRTPINSILGLNEIILRQEDASEEIRRDAGGIQGAGRMLLAIINDILDFSKIEAGKMEIVPVNYNLASTVSEIVNMIWLKAQQKGLELKIEIDPSIPAGLFGDEVRIKQILVNLLNNAVKYTNEGTVTLHIEKEASKDDQVALTFTVSDTGMGIKQDTIPYLFDAFRRIDEEKNSKIEGTGLGLSIVKQLVDLMGGKITVNSVYTQGSSFIVTLWQTVVRYDAIGEVDIKSYGASMGKGGYSAGFTAPDVNVLIVDDNEMNLEVEKKLLKGTEITVDTAMSGQDALLMTSVNRYDIIFMDHLMPEMDGIECMHKIRQQPTGLNNKAPIIVLTANAGSENKELYASSGFEDYLVKPVSGRMLEDMIISHVPETKILISRQDDMDRTSLSATKGYSRKIPVHIATSSVTDLPKQVIRNYQIDVIPFTVHGEGGAFYDGVETEVDEVLRYHKKGQVFETSQPTVAEFEDFFANELKKAVNVIYISSAASLSREYANACEAAEAYGNVQIFDSGVGSSATGLLVLIAQRMAISGERPERIIEELEKTRSITHCSFVTDGSFYMRNKDSYSRQVADIMKTFSIRPILECSEGNMRIERIGFGNFESIYRKYIDHDLGKTKPDTNVIFVMYSDLNDEQKQLIKSRIEKHYEFENVIFQKASSVLSLIAGEGGFGLAFFEGGELSYRLSPMLITDDEEDEMTEVKPDAAAGEREQILATDKEVASFWSEYRAGYKAGFKPGDDACDVTENKTEPKEANVQVWAETKWYDRIAGIDPAMAIENSGSEETFKSVLKIFYESLGDKTKEIEDMFSAGDLSNYTIKVHALKSSAKLIGAAELSEDAQKLEDAGKGNDVEYIDKNHSEFIEKLYVFKEILSDVFSEKEPVETNAGNEPATDKEPQKIDIEKASGKDKETNEKYLRLLIRSIFDMLRESAKRQDSVMINKTIRESEDYVLPDDIQEKINRIKELNENGDYEGIVSVLDE